jgi:hypothetical protein
MLPFKKSIAFGTFPVFACLFFWQEQHMDEDE